MRQVRIALGPDALIVSNKRVNGGVEILATDSTAALESTPSAPAAPSTASASPASQPTSNPAAGTRPPMSPPPRTPGASTQEVMNAISSLKGSLEGRIEEVIWSNQLRVSPDLLSLFQSLLAYGFSTSLLRAMLKRLPANLSLRAAMQWVRKELDTHLPVLKSEDHLWQPGLALAVVGPTGVGKTTTIAKLAAVYKLQRGKDVALITTDTYRIAAVEQLQRYAEILHLPLEVVYTATDLQVAWDRHQKAEMVLIDTAGRSPQQELYLAELKTLLAPIPDIQTVLVVSATTKAEDLDLIFDRFQIFAPDELILTKVDETRSAGTLLNLVDRMKVPVTFVCNGQNVPDDLMVANPQLLADLVLGGANHA